MIALKFVYCTTTDLAVLALLFCLNQQKPISQALLLIRMPDSVAMTERGPKKKVDRGRLKIHRHWGMK